jgi:hypothetical protein
VQEILHFIQIVEVLKETIRIMDEIDKIDFLSDSDEPAEGIFS